MKNVTNCVILFALLSFSLDSFPQYSWPNQVRVRYSNAGAYVDDIVIRFSADPTVTTSECRSWDSRTMNTDNYLASYKGTQEFAIQTRPVSFNIDTVRLKVASTTTGNFSLGFSDFQEFSVAEKIFLVDNYTGTRQNIKLSPLYPFSINADANSKGSERFQLLFISKQLDITCPDVIRANTDAGRNGAVVFFNLPMVARCAQTSVSINPPSGSFFPVGTTNVTLTANDICGNEFRDTFRVVVSDIESPRFQAVENVRLLADKNATSRLFNVTAPAVIDNTGAVNLTATRSDAQPLTAPFQPGTTTITWKAVDQYGNESAISQNIAVAGISKLPPAVFNVNAIGCRFNAGTAADPSYVLFDGAAITNNINSKATLAEATFQPGNNIITWTITDGSGNATTYEQTLAVATKTLPAISNAISFTAVAAPNTIYLGFAPATVLTYTAPVTASSYQWTTTGSATIIGNSSDANIKVTAATTGSQPSSVVLTVTDEFGCAVSVAKAITIQDIRCGVRNEKLMICSKASGQSMCVPASTVKNMNVTSYVLGSCNGTSAREAATTLQVKEAGVALYPNPSNGQFSVRLSDFNTASVEVRIMDMMGRVVASRNVNIGNAQENISFNLSHLSKGTYVLQAMAAGKIYTERVSVLK